MGFCCHNGVALKWGILSTAKINLKFLAGAGDEVVAVASRDGAAAQAYAAEHGIRRWHAGYDALLGDPEVEAVYVPLPNGLHVPWSRRALEAGKHVLCEKPLSRRAAEVHELFTIAGERDRVLMEGFMYRHHPQTRRLAELVADGALGRLRMIVASFSFNAPDPANIRLQRELDGGALMDVGCYCVHAARMLAGEPVRVQAEQTLGGDGVDISFAGMLRFADDTVAHFDCGLSLAPRHGLEVVGEDGTAWLADPWHCMNPGIRLRRGGDERELSVEPADPYRLQLQNFAAAVAGDAAPLLGRADAEGQARTIEALYAAAATP
jgi:predicted dehydrogenase